MEACEDTALYFHGPNVMVFFLLEVLLMPALVSVLMGRDAPVPGLREPTPALWWLLLFTGEESRGLMDSPLPSHQSCSEFLRPKFLESLLETTQAHPRISPPTADPAAGAYP